MAFDQSTRNRLQKFVAESRLILTNEFTRQLQGDYGLDPSSGTVSDTEKLTHLNDADLETAHLLRDILNHYLASSPSEGIKQALNRIVREQAFTVLNRLCALRIAEARGILIESIGKGFNSKGFQLYQRVSGISLGETGDTYRCYLFSLFDEFAVDLAVLFDRFSPMGRLFPKESVLLEILEGINHTEIAHLWGEDETIGWIYQYFNSKEERKKMRDESSAPRNSRELAVRNQFFTPRYVVEFLTDNTLGRIWHEMTKGQTALKEFCQYLVRRPTEIFLAEGEMGPPKEDEHEDLSQEELLKQPVHIPHRQLKDPREILMLDPACGSMHFGLYAFDLYEKIYEEAWNLELGKGPEVFKRGLTLKPLTQTYESREVFLKEVPRLIIEHNIHGVDIDSRAVQIAGLSLWLRAHRSWSAKNLEYPDRPQIRKSNIVCAEPMPGEKEYLKEFTNSLKPKLLGQLVEVIFDKMQLAGEAGSLLKIEEEIKEVIARAKKEWEGLTLKAKDKRGDDLLFTQQELDEIKGKAGQKGLFDLSEITEADFWEQVEQLIFHALKDYSEMAEGESTNQKLLFVEDAARGFAFIDLSRKRYDVVLMNPPFGAPSEKSLNYIQENYPLSKNDLYASFVENAIEITGRGFIGTITSRTGFFLSLLEKWRKELVFTHAPPTIFADLGGGVLEAMVETAAYCLSKSKMPEMIFFRQLHEENKNSSLHNSISKLKVASPDKNTFIASLRSIEIIPGAPLAYWVNDKIRFLFKNKNFDPNYGSVRVGLQTSDDFRFLRLWWEVAPENILNQEGYLEDKNLSEIKDWASQKSLEGTIWFPYAKGGEYSPFFADIHLLVNWKHLGREMKAWADPLYGNSGWSRIIKSVEHYFLPGITWPKVTVAGLSARPMPVGSIFSVGGLAAFPKENNKDFWLAFCNSKLGEILMRLMGAWHNWEAGMMKRLPLPNSNIYILSKSMSKLVENSSKIAEELSSEEESLRSDNWLAIEVKLSIKENCELFNKFREDYYNNLKINLSKINELVYEAYNLNLEDQEIIDDAINSDSRYVWSLPKITIKELVNRYLGITLGCAFGRWEITRFTSNRKKIKEENDDPYFPLAPCAKGMLINKDFLPIKQEELPPNYPAIVEWNGIMVDDDLHKANIISKLKQIIEIIWKNKSEQIELEICENLDIQNINIYLSKPTGFFAEHLKRYSKSRRQAPIYWPLQTPSMSYTLWLYYHRLTDQTLYICVNDFVEPKLKQVLESSTHLRQKTGRTRHEEKELEELIDLERELKEFLGELFRIAKIWKPSLNDGVQITAAPLWKLFQHKPWQKKLKETWQKLEKGEYDWSHLAYSAWPERVIKKSHKDRSLAIAHGLENDLWEEVKDNKGSKGKPKYKWVPKDLSEDELHEFIASKIAEQQGMSG